MKIFFRVYDLIAPRMSAILDLSNQKVMEGMHARVIQITCKELFDDFSYMPVTRDLSAGNRKLLLRWSKLLQEGRALEGPSPPPSLFSPIASDMHYRLDLKRGESRKSIPDFKKAKQSTKSKRKRK